MFARMSLLLALVALALAAVRQQQDSFEQQVVGGKRLIQVSEGDQGTWMTEAEIEQLIHEDLLHFMDITDYPQAPVVNHPTAGFEFPPSLFYQRVVAQITPRLSTARMEAFVEEFSTFHNRYYNTTTGRQSSEWLQAQVHAVVDEGVANGYTGSVSVHIVTHSWPQNSVVARIQGSDPVQGEQILVLGAHQDSINKESPVTGQAPGADDDGSGCAVLLETLRAILECEFVPRRTLEFQWYAAEEVGLLGSQQIANDYNARGVDMVSMMQFDVVGYSGGTRQIGIVTDFTDASANDFLRRIIDEYCSFSWTNRECGYGCSDHASWYRAGYTASRPAMPVEISYHPAIHTERDTMAIVDLDHMLEFAILAVAHSVELGLSTM